MRQSTGPALRPLVFVLASMGSLLGAAALYGRVRGIEFDDFSGDPASVLGGSVYHGALSTVGVLVSWGTAVVCGVAGYALARAGEATAASPLLYLATLFAAFTLDDAYQLHEEIVPKSGVPEEAIMILYAVAGATFAWIHREFLRDSDWPLALLALFLLATSIVIDTWFGWFFGEDASKLMGLAVASLYVVRECLRRLLLLAQARTDATHS